tara:strand:- start:335 stop:1345 length:1011 start_codon:yes stop_codon:yes gene_type:complete
MESQNASNFLKSSQSFATALGEGSGQLASLGREFNTDRLSKIFQKNLQLDAETRNKAAAVSAFAISTGALPQGVKGLYGAGNKLYSKLKAVRSIASEGGEISNEGIQSSLADIGDEGVENIASSVMPEMEGVGRSLLASLRNAGTKFVSNTASELGTTIPSSFTGTIGPQSMGLGSLDEELGSTGLESEGADVVSQPAITAVSKTIAKPITDGMPDEAGGIEMTSIEQSGEAVGENVALEAGDAVIPGALETGASLLGEASALASSTALDFLGPLGILAGIITAGVELGTTLAAKPAPPTKNTTTKLSQSSGGRVSQNVAPSLNTASMITGGTSSF